MTPQFERWNAVRDARGLTVADKALLWVLCTRFDQTTGEWSCSYDSLAVDAAISRRECMRAVERLEKLKVLRVKRRRRPGTTSHFANTYALDITVLHRLASPSQPDVTSRNVTRNVTAKALGGDHQSPASDSQSPGWCPPVTRGGDCVAPSQDQEQEHYKTKNKSESTSLRSDPHTEDFFDPLQDPNDPVIADRAYVAWKRKRMLRDGDSQSPSQEGVKKSGEALSTSEALAPGSEALASAR